MRNRIHLVKVRVLKTEIVLATKFEINFFKFLGLLKVSFVLRDSSKYGKSTSVMYSKTSDIYSENYTEKRGVDEIT